MLTRPFFESAEGRLAQALGRFVDAVARTTGMTRAKVEELWRDAVAEPPTTPPPSPALAPVVETKTESKETKADTKTESKETKADTKTESKETKADTKETKAETKETKAETKETKAETKKSDRCGHLMVRGKNEGKECGNPVRAGTPYCAKHQPAKVVIEDESDAKVESKTDAKVESKTDAKVESKVERPKIVTEKQVRVKEHDESFEASTVMTVSDAKRLDARIKDRESGLQRTYPPVEVEIRGAHRLIAGTDVVLSDSSEILGYLENGELVRSPSRSTDRAAMEYGLSFNSDGIEIDE